jgi:membrane-associated phospholipid phosphatase
MSNLRRDIMNDLAAIDQAVYVAIARQDTPSLDGPLRGLSALANQSLLWVGLATLLGLLGGRQGRRVAAQAMVAVGIASAVVNLGVKQVRPRRRPDRDHSDVPAGRLVPMPTSPSFPSGHSASAFAFASAVGAEMPWLGVPLRALALSVAYSRVHTGVHYPGDTLIGGLIGTVVGQAVVRVPRSLEVLG